MSKTDRADRPRCAALTQAGDQCSRRAIEGSDKCKVHAGKSNVKGRPSKLDRPILEALIKLGAAGTFREQMARAVGIHPSTLYAWLERGEAELDDGKATIYAELSDALTRAEAEAETSMLELIRSHAREDPRSAQWFLERRYPSRYRRRESFEVEGDFTHRTAEEVAPEPGEARDRVVALLDSSGALDVAGKTPRRKGPK